MRCAVVGAGSWGTALAIQLARSNASVSMWARTSEHAEAINTTRENARYLPGLKLPDQLWCSSDLAQVLDGVDVILEVVPSQAVREVMTAAAPHIPEDAVLCCATVVQQVCAPALPVQG